MNNVRIVLFLPKFPMIKRIVMNLFVMIDQFYYQMGDVKAATYTQDHQMIAGNVLTTNVMIMKGFWKTDPVNNVILIRENKMTMTVFQIPVMNFQFY